MPKSHVSSRARPCRLRDVPSEVALGSPEVLHRRWLRRPCASPRATGDSGVGDRVQRRWRRGRGMQRERPRHGPEYQFRLPCVAFGALSAKPLDAVRRRHGFVPVACRFDLASARRGVWQVTAGRFWRKLVHPRTGPMRRPYTMMGSGRSWRKPAHPRTGPMRRPYTMMGSGRSWRKPAHPSDWTDAETIHDDGLGQVLAKAGAPLGLNRCEDETRRLARAGFGESRPATEPRCLGGASRSITPVRDVLAYANPRPISL